MFLLLLLTPSGKRSKTGRRPGKQTLSGEKLESHHGLTATQGPFSPGTTTHRSQSARKLMLRIRSDHLSPLTTSSAHVSWVNQGPQPALWELQTQGKGYWASQGHKLAWRTGTVASRLGLAVPSIHPKATVRNQICGESGCPKSFRAVFLPGSGWHPHPSPLGLCKEEQLGKQCLASLPTNGEANCYRLMGSVNMMGSWTANPERQAASRRTEGPAVGGAWPLHTHHLPRSGPQA